MRGGHVASSGLAVAIFAASLIVVSGNAHGQTEATVAGAVVDRVAVRFYAPETGGATRPRFVTERVLAFEARLDAMSEDVTGEVSAVDERHLRSALDRHVVEEILATLEVEGDEGSPEPARLAREARADVEQRARASHGGTATLQAAAEEEGLADDEVDAVLLRRGRAAAYLDRAVARFLHPADDQLRDVYRTNPHPFRNRAFEDVRVELGRWFVFERLKALESTFLQTARSRVTVVVVPR